MSNSSTAIFNKIEFSEEYEYKLCHAIVRGDPLYILLFPNDMQETKAGWKACPYIANRPEDHRNSIYIILGGYTVAQAFAKSCHICYRGKSPIAKLPTDRAELIRLLFGLLNFDVDWVTVYDADFGSCTAEEMDLLYLIEQITSTGVTLTVDNTYSRRIGRLPMVQEDPEDKQKYIESQG